MNFKEDTEKKVKEIEHIIRKFLPKETGHQKTVIEAMNYSILAGGKRIRPLLMRESYLLFQGREDTIEPFMAALEMIHTYSLIHDDLPAMDDDDYRRGRKTNHIVYGEAMAILAGDGLLNYAYETACKAYNGQNADCFFRAYRILTEKAGIYGMVGGQAVDVEAEKSEKELTEEEVLFIHRNKTAALIESALMIGACMAGADEKEIEKMEQIGYYVGTAFQIQDDILDVTGTESELGKPVGSDAKNNKSTYVTIKGLEAAEEEVVSMSDRALNVLASIQGDSEYLKEIIIRLISRKN